MLATCDRACLLQSLHITLGRPTAETSINDLLTLVGAEYRVPGT